MRHSFVPIVCRWIVVWSPSTRHDWLKSKTFLQIILWIHWTKAKQQDSNRSAWNRPKNQRNQLIDWDFVWVRDADIVMQEIEPERFFLTRSHQQEEWAHEDEEKRPGARVNEERRKWTKERWWGGGGRGRRRIMQRMRTRKALNTTNIQTRRILERKNAKKRQRIRGKQRHKDRTILSHTSEKERNSRRIECKGKTGFWFHCPQSAKSNTQTRRTYIDECEGWSIESAIVSNDIRRDLPTSPQLQCEKLIRRRRRGKEAE